MADKTKEYLERRKKLAGKESLKDIFKTMGVMPAMPVDKKSMGGELSPKQKKIAMMAGDPNKIEGEDFKKLKTMKAGEGEGVDLAKKHKDYVLDKFGTVKGYATEMLGMNDAKKTARKLGKTLGRMGAPGAAVSAGTAKYFKENMSKNKDRLTEKDQESISDFAGGAKAGGVMKAKYGKMVMSRGCKMGRNKPTKLS